MQNSEVSFLKALLLAYSPSGRERAACAYLKKFLSKSGFERVRVDRIGNVLAERGEGKPTILLCGHIDTVRGKLPVKIEDNRIYGRGAVDAKGPLAAMVLAAKEYNGKGKLIICAAVGEESDSRGAIWLSSLPRMADAAIFGEPTGLRAAAYAHRGSISIRLEINTGGGHPATPWGYKNAVEEAFLLVDRIRHSLGSGMDKFLNPSVTITQIRGGGSENRIPEWSSILLDIRFPHTWSASGIYNKIVEILDGASQGYTYSIKMLGATEPFVADKDSVVVRCLREAVLETIGSRLLLVRKTGSGDMGLIGSKWNIPVVTYGPCDPRLSHTKAEFVELEEFKNGIKIYRLTCEKLAESL
ncbi:MAG: M20/M25/M40 family metallo-hydrolase [Thermoproteota archaeon]